MRIQGKTALLLAFALLAAALLPAGKLTADAQTTSPYLSVDKKASEKHKDPDNLRILKGDMYEFKKPSSKYQIAPGYVPDKTGLDTLYISGSAQFSRPQFLQLAQTLRACAEGRTVYIVDLRQESHGFINEGTAVSWYGSHNMANAGMTLPQVEADETQRFAAVTGQTVALNGKEKNSVRIDSFMTEKELVESEGFRYLRIPITDHTWPTAEEIDTFIAFAKSIDRDGVWLHFHCKAGHGRTGIMMTLCDMMRNPEVPMQDVVVRHTMLGGGYPFYTEDSDSYKAPLYREKAMMMPLLYEYVQENHGTNYEISWSQWLKLRRMDDAA